jgi:hypothetical protein
MYSLPLTVNRSAPGMSTGEWGARTKLRRRAGLPTPGALSCDVQGHLSGKHARLDALSWRGRRSPAGPSHTPPLDSDHRERSFLHPRSTGVTINVFFSTEKYLPDLPFPHIVLQESPKRLPTAAVQVQASDLPLQPLNLIKKRSLHLMGKSAQKGSEKPPAPLNG